MSSQSSKLRHAWSSSYVESVTVLQILFENLGTYLGEVQAKIHIHLYIIMKLVGIMISFVLWFSGVSTHFNIQL